MEKTPICNHILRNVPFHLCQYIADWHDNAIWQSLLALFDIQPALVGDVSWFVSSLPIRYGGLGFRSCSRLAAAIHWAAWADSFENLHKRFPALAAKIRAALDTGSTAPSLEYVRDSVVWLQGVGFVCPSWTDLKNGVRPRSAEQIGNESDPAHFKHGWQFYATQQVYEQEHQVLHAQLNPTQQAMLRSQAGIGAGDWLLAIPSSNWFKLADNLFLLALRRRMFLPLPAARSSCTSCLAPLDEFGHHLLSCTRSGWLKRRATGLERAWVQVLSEAGANSQHRPLLRDLAIPGVVDTDTRQLDIIAGGLPLFGGKTIIGDATLRSPVSGVGTPHGGQEVNSANTDGYTFAKARRDKIDTYPELANATARHKFLVLGSEVGGRFSSECVDLVHQLVELKARHASDEDCKLVKLVYFRRWWGILSVAVQRAVSMNLLGGDWAPAIALEAPSDEELLCATIVPPSEPRMR